MIDIIVPTYNNVEQLNSFLDSLRMSGGALNLFKVIVVNNGAKEGKEFINVGDMGIVVNADKNLGWEGGLKLGLEHSDAPFVLFANDDIFIPPFSSTWLQQMLVWFNDPEVGAVGPSSNVVMGLQNMFQPIPHRALEVSYLIGFCMMVRRETLEKCGGVDDTLPGGDDLDLSIRLTSEGYKLIALRDLFVFHHGFQTGQKVHGSYWNSQGMTEKTNHALIQKHGLRKFYDCVSGYRNVAPAMQYEFSSEDTEGDFIREYVTGESVLEVGCGATKTVPHAVGLDMVPARALIPFLGKSESVAEIESDASGVLPFDEGTLDTIIARHLLEHCLNPIETLENWVNPLKTGGRLIIASPNHELGNSIIMNPQHLHAFNAETLKSMAEKVGLKEVTSNTNINGVAFVGVYEKV